MSAQNSRHYVCSQVPIGAAHEIGYGGQCIPNLILKLNVDVGLDPNLSLGVGVGAGLCLCLRLRLSYILYFLKSQCPCSCQDACRYVYTAAVPAVTCSFYGHVKKYSVHMSPHKSILDRSCHHVLPNFSLTHVFTHVCTQVYAWQVPQPRMSLATLTMHLLPLLHAPPQPQRYEHLFGNIFGLVYGYVQIRA